MTTHQSSHQSSRTRQSQEQSQDQDQDQDRHPYRPRWVWGGLLGALVGLGLLGVGLVLSSLWTSVTGSVLLVAGTASSLLGGVLYDAVPHLSARRQLKQVRRGEPHEGVSPHDMVREPVARLEARQTTERTQDILSARPGPPAPLAPIAGWALLGVTALVVVSQPWFVAHSTTGRDSAFRDMGLVIIIGLAGLRIATVPGRRTIAVALALLSGIGLLLGGLIAPHGQADLAVLETICGLLTIGLALAGGARPVPRQSDRVRLT